MTKTPDRTSWRLARAAALPALLLAVAAAAQAPGSVQDFQLPAARPTPTASAAGPVDSEHPTAEPTRAAPPEAATAPASPAPAPAITVPPPAAVTSPTPQRTEPAPRATAASQSVPAPSGSPVAEATPTLTLPTAAPSAVPTDIVAEPTVAEPAAPIWPWLAGGAVLLALLGTLLHRRSRGAFLADEAYAPAEPAPLPVQPEPSPPATLPRPQELNKAPPPAPTPPAPPAVAGGPLEMQFEARHLSRAMVNAALAYRLTLTNRADSPTGPLRLAGDIVSAHASLSAEEQLLPADAALATLHETLTLAPGESISLSGELRMPIASILPIHRGNARVFVPLARFRAEAGNGTAATHVFVVGQVSERPGGALRPFPLDRGPGVDRGLGQRELGVPA